MRTGAEIVWACLVAEGVDTVFGYPGGAVIPLYDALRGSGVRHILTRHEQGAVFAAEGYARATGRVGVAIATSGPGATNLVTGIADARMDSVPLVCITGQVRTSLIGTDAFQETDVFGMTLSLTKWNRLVLSTEEIPEVVAEGFHIARSGRPGPVLLDVPVDVLKGKAEVQIPGSFRLKPKPRWPHATRPDFPAATLRALLQSSTRPTALVGAGAKLSGAHRALERLLDCLQVPTGVTLHGLGAVPYEKPYFLGLVGMHGSRAANVALNEADLLLVFGARLDDRVTGDPTKFAPTARIVHLEIDPSQLDRVRSYELPILGDLAETIPQFHEAIADFPLPDWSAWKQAIGELRSSERNSPGAALPALRFFDELYALLPDNAIVVADVGQHQMWAAQRYRAHSPRGFITSGGLGAMGFALPGAIGVQLARPDALVVCISGDGGIQMNIQELATVRRYALSIKLIILDNKFLGMVRQWQQLFYDRNYAETDLSDNPDFTTLAAAYGIQGHRMGIDPTQADGLSVNARDVLKRFLDSPDPQVLVFDCPPEANVFPMVPSGAAISEMLLEEN
jgi:acetolactate synthase I/II/III large subunit